MSAPKKLSPVEFHVKSSEWKKMPSKTKAALSEMVKAVAKMKRKTTMTQFWKCNKCGSRGAVHFTEETTARQLLMEVHHAHEVRAPACPWKETKIRMAKITDPKLKLPA